MFTAVRGAGLTRTADQSGDGRRVPQVPVNLLRAGRIFVFEPPPGVKANMLRTFSSIPVSRICKVKARPAPDQVHVSVAPGTPARPVVLGVVLKCR